MPKDIMFESIFGNPLIFKKKNVFSPSKVCFHVLPSSPGIMAQIPRSNLSRKNMSWLASARVCRFFPHFQMGIIILPF